jgi:hypothetical protein
MGAAGAAIAAGGVMASSAVVAQSRAARPNILFILMDNLGYGELGVYGGGELRGAPTPRIDQLATEGTRLTNFNVEAECTPSRSAIMTGRFSIRSGTQSVPIGGEFDGLTRWEVTEIPANCAGDARSLHSVKLTAAVQTRLTPVNRRR